MTRPNRFNDPFQNLEDRARALREQARMLRDEQRIELAQEVAREIELEERRTEPFYRAIFDNGTTTVPTTTFTTTNATTIAHWENLTNVRANIYDFLYRTLEPTTTQQFINPADLTFTQTVNHPYNEPITAEYLPTNINAELYTPAIDRMNMQENALRAERRRQVAAFKAIYKKWEQRNKYVKARELNTSYGNFKKQSKFSIEVLLLEAIANRKLFKTKTTEYDPNTNSVFLLNQLILRFNPLSFRVENIHFPTLLSDREEALFRHRLRQLGVRCLKIKRNTRIYLDSNYYKIIKQGEILDLSSVAPIYCLPQTWQDRSYFELPSYQYDLFGGRHIVELKQFEYNKSGYKCSFSLEMTGNSLTVAAKAEFGENLNGVGHYLQYHRVITADFWSQMGPIETIKMVSESLNKRIDEDRHKRKIEMVRGTAGYSGRTIGGAGGIGVGGIGG